MSTCSVLLIPAMAWATMRAWGLGASAGITMFPESGWNVKSAEGKSTAGAVAGGVEVEDDALALAGVEAEAVGVSGVADLAGQNCRQDSSLRLRRGVVRLRLGETRKLIHHHSQRVGNAGGGDEAELAVSGRCVGGGDDAQRRFGVVGLLRVN